MAPLEEPTELPVLSIRLPLTAGGLFAVGEGLLIVDTIMAPEGPCEAVPELIVTVPPELGRLAWLWEPAESVMEPPDPAFPNELEPLVIPTVMLIEPAVYWDGPEDM